MLQSPVCVGGGLSQTVHCQMTHTVQNLFHGAQIIFLEEISGKFLPMVHNLYRLHLLSIAIESESLGLIL